MKLITLASLALATLALTACGGPDDPAYDDVIVVEHDTSSEALWGMLTGTSCSCAGQVAPPCPAPTTSLGAYCSPDAGGCSLQAICQNPPPAPPTPPGNGDPECGPGTGRICN